MKFPLQGSRDNMSIEIVTFPGAPGVSEEAVKREAEVDARIEILVKGTVNSIN